MIFFACTSKGPCETIEDINEIRFLENGEKIKMISVNSQGLSVDTPKEFRAYSLYCEGATFIMLPLKMLVLDVDGTLTDGKIYMGEQGELMKAFHAHDAQGLRKLSRLGIKTIILTGRESNIVLLRAKEMEISQVYQKVRR